ncbi:MAG: integration host factor subunit beta [Verrucomicrobiales bacterium]|nr:integration host factor subunit beta [Verrucomicrobiales bacterium]
MDKVVTKRDLVYRIAKKENLTRNEVFQIIEQLIMEITDSLSEGDQVVFRNFGAFQVGINRPKVGRNPTRPEVDIVIPAKRVVRFRPGKVLKERVDDL